MNNLISNSIEIKKGVDNCTNISSFYNPPQLKQMISLISIYNGYSWALGTGH
ncbi:hypothetical protein [Flavobacterium sp. DSR2-3-3]|uniref:hypothetical protein n=1 Tax=Flavobacterium sp. DSR2-3-3 TaxID=2804632 RepID=UPI003CE7B81F